MRLLLAAAVFALSPRRRWRDRRSRADDDHHRRDRRLHPAGVPRVRDRRGDAEGRRGGAVRDAVRERARARRRTSSSTVVVAYSRVEFVRLGPLGVGDRAERLLFWPDTKGIALRQVQAALARQGSDRRRSGDARKARASRCRGWARSSSCCSAPAARRLATADGAYRCSYAAAITTLIAELAHDARHRVAGHVRRPGRPPHMLDPKPDAQDYRTPTRGAREARRGADRRHRRRSATSGCRRSSARARARRSRSRRCSGARA